jgi:preprotein translocase subunit YajC
MTSDSLLINALIYYLPLLAILLVWYFAIRRMRSGSINIQSMNSEFKKQNEEIIRLLTEIRDGLKK